MSGSSTSYLIFTNPDVVSEKAKSLIDLVWAGPGEQKLDHGNWAGLLGPSMLLKAAGTLQSIMLLMPARGTVDAIVLLRTLYENVVALSWIAIDPDKRMDMWVATSAYWELEEHRDWKKVGGGLRTDDEVRDLKERRLPSKHEVSARRSRTCVPH